jgi:uncharacterized membrane protein (DUF485 family)
MAQAIASAEQTGDSQTRTRSGLSSYVKSIADPHRSLLLLRFILLNLFAFAMLGVAWSQGYVQMVIDADKTYLSLVIFAVFMIGLIICSMKVWQTNNEIDALNSSDGVRAKAVQHLVSVIDTPDADSRANLSGSLRMRIAHRISVVRHLANTLVLLGLIGTVLGFIIALSGVDPDTASDVNAIAPMVSMLIKGMSTALYTTLIGSILNVWLMANYQILAGGTVQLIGSLQEAVEKNA